MEKEEKDALIKLRSSRTCIRDGYLMFTNNFKNIFRRTWPLALGFAVISAIASALPVLVSPALFWPSLLLEIVAIILLLILVNKKFHKQNFFQKTDKIAFSSWFRHLGMLSLVFIVTLTVVAIFTLFTSLPTFIMMAANWESQMGVINGDPTGMPHYVLWLSIGAFLIAGFLSAYIWMTVICPFYLTRISIAIQERDRNEFNKNLKKEKNEKNLIHRQGRDLGVRTI